MNASTLFILCIAAGLGLLAESAITAYFLTAFSGAM